MTMKRLPTIPEAEWNAAQRAAADEMKAGPRGHFGGPWPPFLYSPELLRRAQHLGAFIRYDSKIDRRLREFAMCITARHWRNGLEWSVHSPEAEKLGVNPRALALLAKNEVPAPLKEDERAVYEFCTELHRNHLVSDSAYAELLKHIGNSGIVEMTALCGYYALLAMVMNVAELPPPQGFKSPF
ncbi:MAG: carboxymuconolactone decarboxylase family protein [Alphaproteobacteria bacterium]